MSITLRTGPDLERRLKLYQASNPGLSAARVAEMALDAFLPDVRPAPHVRPGGAQDEITGRQGHEFGVRAGRALAEQIGELTSPVATELKLPDGRMATLRTAKGSNTQWGCLNAVLERVQVVLCAYTIDGKNFDVWEVDADVWRREGRNASSGHKHHDKMTLMSKSSANTLGRRFGRYSISDK